MAVRANDAWKLSYPSHRAIQNRNNQTSSPRHTAEQCLKTKFNLPVIYFSFSELGIELTRLPPWSTNALCVFVEMHSAPPRPPPPIPLLCCLFPGWTFYICLLSPSSFILKVTLRAQFVPDPSCLARSLSNYTWRVAPVPRLPALTPWCVEACVSPCAFFCQFVLACHDGCAPLCMSAVSLMP